MTFSELVLIMDRLQQRHGWHVTLEVDDVATFRLRAGTWHTRVSAPLLDDIKADTFEDMLMHMVGALKVAE